MEQPQAAAQLAQFAAAVAGWSGAPEGVDYDEEGAPKMMAMMENDGLQHSWELLCMLAERRSGVQRGCDGESRSPDFADAIDPVSTSRERTM